MISVSNDHLRDLGWPRILRAVSERTATDAGRDAALALQFLPNVDAMRQTLAQVDELMTLLAHGSDLPLAGLGDIRGALVRASRGATLAGPELVQIARTADAAVSVRRHLAHHKEASPALAPLGARLPDLSVLAGELLATFDDAGNVRDDASPELASARHRVIGLHRGMKDRLERFLARAEIRESLQDSFYTQREERYVLPVVAGLQRDLPGIIHGTSNSGETVFVEPHELVDGNNQIKIAEEEVRRELERVLRIRSEWVASEGPALESAFAELVALDTLQARARLGHDLDATAPTFSLAGALHLRRARNPHLVLKGTAVVPNDITLAPEQSFLVITGPNTGGKTVTLSTVGTAVLMAAIGMPIPAAPGSVVPVVRSLFALIGDAQDLERDLSTFSGHLLALQGVLDAAEPGALALLDELVVGTEPTQGAALAIAVLESLASRGARGLVTTHYERLKTLPFEDARFANAAVGIDPETMAPTFVLTEGRPGSSNPFDIALRLGFSPRLIARARDVAGGHGGLAEALDRLRLAEEDAARSATEARTARIAAETEQRRLNDERARLRAKAREEIETVYAEARAELRSVVARVREARARLDATTELSAARLEEERRALEALEHEARRALPTPEPVPEPKRPEVTRDGARDGGPLAAEALRIGLAVWVRPLSQAASITELRGDHVVVTIGALRVTVPAADLAKLAGVAQAAPVGPVANAPRKSVAIIRAPERAPELPEDDGRVPAPRSNDNSCDLRGARRDEVAERVEPLLDRAFRERADTVWIIHGHGTGAIRDEVRELVARSPHVAGFRRGRRHEGGDGVTLAFLHRD